MTNNKPLIKPKKEKSQNPNKTSTKTNIDALVYTTSKGETFDSGLAVRTSLTTVKSIDATPKEYTKAGEHLVKQTLGKSPSPKQMTIFDLADNDQNNKEYIEKYGINEIGAMLSVSERKALHTIQTLYSETNYEGNQRGGKLRIKISDYLETYGVNKKTTKRGFKE